MRYCTNCGHRLGVGRYCTNCGARVIRPDSPEPEADHPTVVRAGEIPPVPVAAPPPPPDPGPPPTSARYPLYADTVATPPPAAARSGGGRGRRSLLPWLLALLAILLIAVTGGLLLLLGPSEDDGQEGVDGGRDDGPAGAVDELDPADVTVPGIAPPSVDEDGNPVTYTAANLLDADPRTCWRMPGDGTGSVVTFTFDETVTVTEVGLVNGYAKTDPPHDWYAGNRRITEVAWVFDDGSEVIQDLAEEPSLQRVPVNAIKTQEIELRILEVTEPGDGPDSRDYTAISDVVVSGSS
ncbi:zinc ribbon domain-containing protein [Nocardioides antri]|uniref:Zinc ribbon domain-containing protein n=1 Tax=Nocardioides antri TaxID=2607659 RepID=A0A5B1M8G5_9ACTN|nr:zinc ribbon domain-containing protein [Nocardioides antri]KAA1428974.1 zinc ribbon domain-containing protein [Nocardioides antri]